MTEIKRFSGPCSSLMVATFEPLFTSWVSLTGLRYLQCALAKRIVKTVDRRKDLATPLWDKLQWHPLITRVPVASVAPSMATGARVTGVQTAATVNEGFVTQVQREWSSQSMKRHAVLIERTFNKNLSDPQQLLRDLKAQALPVFMPLESVEGEIARLYIQYALSPLGILHLYRQLHFPGEEGVGPVEQAFTVAPAETVEIVQESTIRRTSERVEEFGTETTTESEREERTQDDISNQVDNSIKRDLQVGISAHGGVNTGVYNFGANLTTNIGLSTQTSRQQIQKHMTALTRKESEKTRNSYSLKFRTLEEVTEFSRMRRTITNNSADPVNYGLRRVLRTMKVKLQSMGPRLCWLIYVENPGLGLGTSEFVMYRPSSPAVVADVPAGSPAKPAEGSATGSQVIGRPSAGTMTQIRVYSDSTKEVYGLTINQIVDVSPEGGKDVPVPPEAKGVVEVDTTAAGLPAGAAEFKVQVDWHDTKSAEIHYTYYYRPSVSALKAWEEQVNLIRKRISEQELEDQFSRAKKLLAAQSKVKARPSADLRAEERYEILGRMIRVLFGGNPGEVSPLEIEFFHRYFDISALFFYIHPSWWKPRYTKAGATRQAYKLTDETDPAPLGSSLGWLLQLDGDRRRNEFLNSPWVRVCLPFRPGVEREGVKYLAEHIEGQIGYSMLSASELDELIKRIEEQRALENKPLASPEYLTQTGEHAPAPDDAVNAYPVIAEYDVVVPTEGFLYDRLDIHADS